jgi:hypothetical protein
MPGRMSGWHGGAVPARPARDYPGRTSSQHHRRCTHTWTTASTHNKHNEEIKRGVSSEAIGAGEILSGDRPPISSERRGVPNPLGRGGRGSRGASYARVSVAEVTGVGRDLQAMAAATSFAGGAREKKRGERARREWVGSV